MSDADGDANQCFAWVRGVLQRVAACCSLMQCVAACCSRSVLQLCYRHGSVLQCLEGKRVDGDPNQCFAWVRGVLQRVAVWCSVLQCLEGKRVDADANQCFAWLRSVLQRGDNSNSTDARFIHFWFLMYVRSRSVTGTSAPNEFWNQISLLCGEQAGDNSK